MAAPPGPEGTPVEVFGAFLKLGLTSFGGPVAHLGYFRDELVQRRRWLSESAYADLVALCQFLPGPASSQVGFALGMMRAGWAGALAAFVAFTLPSALVMLGFALTAASLGGPVGTGALNGLKIVAVAIVAQAVWGMGRALCPDRARASIALVAVALLAVAPGAPGMLGAILLGGLAGLALGKGQGAGQDEGPAEDTRQRAMGLPVGRGVALAALALFAGGLVVLPFLAGAGPVLALIDAFYRSGALVFGGGHVVLPLLEAETVAPGHVSADGFLAGYGAAQALPGPLFTFAAYLGAVVAPGQGFGPGGVWGGGLALLAVFMPGFLLLVAVLPFWDRFRRLTQAQSAMQGANAAVVGVLGAALYDPVFVSAVGGMRDFALALACLLLLTLWKAPPWMVVILAALGGVGLALMA